MSFIQSLASAFKARGNRVPLARSYLSPWLFSGSEDGRVPIAAGNAG